MDQFLSMLPDEHARKLKDRNLNMVDEVRICVNQPVLVRTQDSQRWVGSPFTSEMVEDLLRRICHQSVYAYQQTLCRGYVTLDGGNRVGVCGTGLIQGNDVRNITQPHALVYRKARQISGCAEGLLGAVDSSLLMIGPPCSGKTTLLRDLVRLLSDRLELRVSLVDERGEVAAVLRGTPQLNVGKRTDVMTEVPKKQGILMMLRSMNPQWIAVDEITDPEDIKALEQASYCGVKLLATAHASSLSDLYKRPLYKNLMDRRIFSSVVVLQADRSYCVQEVSK